MTSDHPAPPLTCDFAAAGTDGTEDLETLHAYAHDGSPDLLSHPSRRRPEAGVVGASHRPCARCCSHVLAAALTPEGREAAGRALTGMPCPHPHEKELI